MSHMKSRDISQYVRHHNSCLRMNKTIVEKARCLRMNIGLAKNFQVEAMNMTCFLIKRLSIVALDMKIEEEVWISNTIDYYAIRMFGFSAYVHVSSEERSKLDAKSRQCIFIGY